MLVLGRVAFWAWAAGWEEESGRAGERDPEVGLERGRDGEWNVMWGLGAVGL